MPTVHIGCSGFTYPHWRGTFYPENLSRRHWLAHYCRVLASIELNVTFYRLVKPATFQRWRDETPPGFVFAVKGSRFITHVKRLAEPENPLAKFFSGVLQLEGKLAAVLWQFPPNLACNTERLARFLDCLQAYPVRNALEFRHESWLREEVQELCRSHNAAITMADWPLFIDTPPLTADFVYIRRHGHEGHYNSCYTAGELEVDACRIRAYLASGLDVYIYFNNDNQGYAPRNALELALLMSGKT